jgi:hypothetical protein
MLEKDLVPNEESLALKELGFDEPCFMYYSDNGELYKSNLYGISAPTYSQAFRWFREKHNLRSFVDTIVHDVDSPNDWIYYFQVKMGNGIDTQPYYSGDFNSYEEAELGCLRKLIKKVKNEK